MSVRSPGLSVKDTPRALVLQVMLPVSFLEKGNIFHGPEYHHP